MNTLNKKQQDLEKEIKEQSDISNEESEKGLINFMRGKIIIEAKAELKGIKFAKKEMLKEMDAIIKKLESVCDDCEGHCNCFVQLFMKLGELRNG